MEKVNIVDSVGNEVLTGDIVRMFHYQTGRKKYYMYKRVRDFEQIGQTFYVVFDHLNDNGQFRRLAHKQYNDIVIVQRAKFHNNPRLDELKRNPKMKD